jgi:HAMP domain-containing protein
MRTISIKLKLAGIVVASLGLVALVNAGMAWSNYHDDMAYEAERSIRSAAKAFADLERREVEKLSSTLDALLLNPAFTALLAQRDRAGLLELAGPMLRELRHQHGISLLTFIEPDPSRACLLRVHRPELSGDKVLLTALDAAIRTGTTASGIEFDRAGLALRVVRPVAAQGRILGYVELGEGIEGFLSRLKGETLDELALVMHKGFLEEKAWAASRGVGRNNWGDDPDVVSVETTSPEVLARGTIGDVRQVPEGGRFIERYSLGPRRLVRGVLPVHDAAGRTVGGLFVVHDVAALREKLREEQLRVIVLTGLLALVVLVVILFVLERLVFLRLEHMTRAMEDASTRLAGGDYEIGGTISRNEQDEIGRFESFLGSFLGTIGATFRQLEKRRRGG